MKKTNNVIIQSLHGLAYGYFISYGLGTLVILISSYIHIDILSTIGSYMQSLMGVGIAVGIAMATKANGFNTLCMILSGGIASYFSSYLIIIYLAILLPAELLQFIDTYFDIWLKPLLAVIISLLISYIFNPYINTFMNYLGNYFNIQMNSDSLIMRIVISMIIAIIMGFLVSSPIGGVSICALMNVNSVVCGIALSGVCSYTIGLVIMGLKDNHMSDTLAILIGTPILGFINIIKKPIILIPLMLSSAISGILTGCIFMIEAPTTASYGMMVFQGIVDTIAYNNAVYMPAILLINIAVPIVVCFMVSQLLYHLKLIKHGDLKIEHL
ncbi:MAG: PTS sugar transporter subunit IIC [Erysipelotrichaceae bacterium]|nr:PTS sugar transporter subunit IIC [Erysipelotrichaceae bacterium]